MDLHQEQKTYFDMTMMALSKISHAKVDCENFEVEETGGVINILDILNRRAKIIDWRTRYLRTITEVNHEAKTWSGCISKRRGRSQYLQNASWHHSLGSSGNDIALEVIKYEPGVAQSHLLRLHMALFTPLTFKTKGGAPKE